MIRCTRCCMPNTRPDTPHIDGVCSACLTYEHRPQINWVERRDKLRELLDRHRNRVIVPSSGGKDSTAQVIQMLELGADVTVVTARTCHLTRIGRANIDNLARYARTIEVVPNMTIRATLNRIGLQRVGDISWPEHASIFTVPFRVATQTGHTLIMYGENPQAEYGGPIGSEQAVQMSRRWVTEFGGFLGLRPDDFIGEAGITESDMADYQPPPQTYIEAHFLGMYIPWDSRANLDIAITHGIQAVTPSPANWWKGENMDNAQTGVHDHFMWLKYGFGRGCQQISVDVRAGRISRDHALAWVEEFDHLPPSTYMGVPLGEVLGQIRLGRNDFDILRHRFMDKAAHAEA